MRGQKSMVQKQVSSEPYQNVQLARMFLRGTTCNDSLKFPFQKKKKITFFFSFIFIQSWFFLIWKKKKPLDSKDMFQIRLIATFYRINLIFKLLI